MKTVKEFLEEKQIRKFYINDMYVYTLLEEYAAQWKSIVDAAEKEIQHANASDTLIPDTIDNYIIRIAHLEAENEMLKREAKRPEQAQKDLEAWRSISKSADELMSIFEKKPTRDELQETIDRQAKEAEQYAEQMERGIRDSEACYMALDMQYQASRKLNQIKDGEIADLKAQLFTQQPTQPERLPFDLGVALKQPERVVTRDGRKVSELHYFSTQTNTPFCICFIVDGQRKSVTKNGLHDTGGNDSRYDLFLLPETVETKTMWGNYYKGNNRIYLYEYQHEAIDAADFSSSDYIATVPITIPVK